MTSRQQQIKIAELLGYKWPGLREEKDSIGWTLGGAYIPRLPEFTTDLNAMHEAEKILSPDEKMQYLSNLYNLCQVHGSNLKYSPIYASATDKAKTFLQTINGRESAL